MCKNTLFDIFKRVEIEINTHCNRKCSYCPNADKKFIEAGYMELNLYKKIIDELEMLQFKGRLSYHFYNEPLLHPNIDDFVSYAHCKLPDIENVLYTNGDFLTESKHASLVQAGVLHFVVTKHGNNNVRSCENMTLLTPDKLTITNRGGYLFDIGEPMRSPCYAPTDRLVIGYDGDIILCYEDAKKEVVFGNINDSTIKDIWLSEKYIKVRAELKDGMRYKFSPCSKCNNLAHSEPNYVSKICIKKSV